MAANLLTMRTPRKTIRPMRMSSRVPHTLIDMRQGYHRNKLGYNARHKKKYIDTDHAASVNNQRTDRKVSCRDAPHPKGESGSQQSAN